MKKFYISALVLLLGLSNSFTEVRAQFTNVRVSDSLDADPEEVSIAIDQHSPSHLAAGANLDYFFNSTNSGQTWTEGHLTSSFGVWGDPVVAFDGQGRLYYVHLSSRPNLSNWLDRIVVQRSNDQGLTWDDGAATAPNSPAQQDKAWIAIDGSTGKYAGNLYMSWTQFDHYGTRSTADSSHILFSRSTNGGASWTPPLRIDRHGGDCIDSSNTVEGAVPAVGPNGEVYISWAGSQGIVFTRSIDGGVTFEPEHVVKQFPGPGWTFDVPGIYRCNGLPVTLCDAGSSGNRGAIYILWSDQGRGADNTDIFLMRSNDQGATWTSPRRVTDDTGRHQHFFPAMAIDEKTGYLYATFYDRRMQSGDTTDVYLARSTDGGMSFSNLRVSEAAFFPNRNRFFGDYIHIAAYDGKIYPIWMRMDQNALSVWTALVTEPVVGVAASASTPMKPSLTIGYPEGFSGKVTLRFALPRSEMIALELFNEEGKLVRSLEQGSYAKGSYQFSWDGNDASGAGTASGIFFARLRTMSGSFQPLMQKILRVR